MLIAVQQQPSTEPVLGSKDDQGWETCMVLLLPVFGVLLLATLIREVLPDRARLRRRRKLPGAIRSIDPRAVEQPVQREAPGPEDGET